MSRFFRKLTAVILAAVMIISFSACGSRFDDYEVLGGEKVVAVRENFAALDSGVLTVLNTETGEKQGEFTFYYDKKDVLHFSYEATYGGEPYYEYYDGKALNIQRNGEAASYKWPNANYKKYKRGKDTHPNASGGIFFYEPACMFLEEDGKTAVVVKTEDDNGECYSYSYDMEVLSKYMATETNEGKMTSFEVKFFFDKEGNFLRMEEISTLENGTTYSSTVVISRQNEIDEVTNFIKE